MPLRGRARKPPVGFYIALGSATPRQVHPAEVVLTGGKLLFGRAAIPGNRFGVDLQASPALFVGHSQLILGGSITLFRQAPKALLSLRNTALRGISQGQESLRG